MKQSLLARIVLLLLLVFFPCFLMAPSLTVSCGDAAEAFSEKEVERLIEDLGSEDFKVREAATHTLIDLEDEPPALRRALKSPDAEVRRRVARILEARLSKRARRGLVKAQALAKEGRVDELVERLVLWEKWDHEKEGTKAVAKLAARLIEWEHRNFGKTVFLSKNFPLPSFVKHVPNTPITPKEFAEMWTRSTHLRGNEIVLNKRQAETYLRTIVITASEKIRTPFLIGISGSVVIAGGNVQLAPISHNGSRFAFGDAGETA